MTKAAPARELSAKYIWEFPGTPVRVHLPFPVVDQLQEYLNAVGESAVSAGRESGGLLLGKAKPGHVEVSGIRMFKLDREKGCFLMSDAERQALRAELTEAGHPVVGYFRTGVHTGIRLCDEDMLVVKELFEDPKYVFLVMRVEEEGVPTAGIFFWDSGHIFQDATFMPFPLDTQLLGTAPEPAPPPPPTREPEAAAAVSGESTPPSRGRTLLALGGCLLIAVAAFAIALFLRSGGLATTPGKPEAPANAALTVEPVASTVAAQSVSLLGLSASTTGRTVSLTWNPKAPDLADARVAVLILKDGPAEREMPLTKAQLEIGKLVYTPRSSQLEVTMEVYRSNGKPLRESLLVAVTAPPAGAAGLPGSGWVANSAVRPNSTPLPGGIAPSNPAVSTSSAALPSPAPALTPTPSRTFTPPAQRPAPPADPIVEPTLPPSIAVGTRLPEQAPVSALEAASRQGLPLQARAPSTSPTSETGPQLRPPQVRRQVQPVVSSALSAMLKRRVELQVKIQIDTAGRVTEAQALGQQNALSELLARSAVEAAKRWTFDPAQRGATALPSEMVLKFSFGPN